MRGFQLFAENGEPENENDARREELDKAQRRVGQLARGDGEQQQREGGESSTGNDREAEFGGYSEGRTLGLRIIKRDPERRQKQQGRFDRQPGDRSDRDLLANQAVAAEAERERQADPQGCQRACCEQRYTDGSKRDGDPLPSCQPLAEQHRAQQDVDQRVYVIAQAGGIDLPVLDRPDIDHPVDRDQRGAEREPAKRPAMGERHPQFGPLLAQQRDEQAQRQRPDDAPANEFERGHAANQQQIERHQPPDDVGAKRSRQSGAIERGGGAVHWRALGCPGGARKRNPPAGGKRFVEKSESDSAVAFGSDSGA